MGKNARRHQSCVNTIDATKRDYQYKLGLVLHHSYIHKYIASIDYLLTICLSRENVAVNSKITLLSPM